MGGLPFFTHCYVYSAGFSEMLWCYQFCCCVLHLRATVLMTTCDLNDPDGVNNPTEVKYLGAPHQSDRTKEAFWMKRPQETTTSPAALDSTLLDFFVL